LAGGPAAAGSRIDSDMLLRRVRQLPDRRPILIATPLPQSLTWCTGIAFIRRPPPGGGNW